MLHALDQKLITTTAVPFLKRLQSITVTELIGISLRKKTNLHVISS